MFAITISQFFLSLFKFAAAFLPVSWRPLVQITLNIKSNKHIALNIDIPDTSGFWYELHTTVRFNSSPIPFQSNPFPIQFQSTLPICLNEFLSSRHIPLHWTMFHESVCVEFE